MKILVLNCGSSSLKYQLIDMDNESVMAKGLCERIGIEGSKLTHKANGKELVVEEPMPKHTEAIALVMKALVDPEYGVIKDTSEISAVGHHTRSRVRRHQVYRIYQGKRGCKSYHPRVF